MMPNMEQQPQPTYRKVTTDQLRFVPERTPNFKPTSMYELDKNISLTITSSIEDLDANPHNRKFTVSQRQLQHLLVETQSGICKGDASRVVLREMKLLSYYNGFPQVLCLTGDRTRKNVIGPNGGYSFGLKPNTNERFQQPITLYRNVLDKSLDDTVTHYAKEDLSQIRERDVQTFNGKTYVKIDSPIVSVIRQNQDKFPPLNFASSYEGVVPMGENLIGAALGALEDKVFSKVEFVDLTKPFLEIQPYQGDSFQDAPIAGLEENDEQQVVWKRFVNQLVIEVQIGYDMWTPDLE